MKRSFSKCLSGIGIVFLLISLAFFLMPPSSGEAIESVGKIANIAFWPGMMILLGGVLIGAAAWGRKQHDRNDDIFSSGK